MELRKVFISLECLFAYIVCQEEVTFYIALQSCRVKFTPEEDMLLGLDLFSGVGGISYALKDIVKPIAYCDWEEEARLVLRARMESGHIPRAPICEDVRNLNKAWLRKASGKKPDCVLAGFPCVGFSSAGSRAGFENEESALFFEILRIVDEFPSVKLLFLENVPGVVKNGLDIIAGELCVKRGFKLRWTLMSACEVGAPQKRRRWYAIAYRGTAALAKLGWNDLYDKQIPHKWDLKRAPVRMVAKKPYKRTARHRLLGNSVVPAAIRWGYKFLSSKEAEDSLRPTLHKPSHGEVEATGKTLVWRKLTARKKTHVPDFKLVFDPAVYKAPAHAVRTEKTITKVQYARTFATPTTSYHATFFLTPRNKLMLATQLRFERNTPDHLRGAFVNVAFVEWLMGYPVGFSDDLSKKIKIIS